VLEATTLDSPRIEVLSGGGGPFRSGSPSLFGLSVGTGASYVGTTTCCISVEGSVKTGAGGSGNIGSKWTCFSGGGYIVLTTQNTAKWATTKTMSDAIAIDKMV